MSNMPRMIANCKERLEAARAIADSVRHNDELHKVAMKAVFIMEDILESLVHGGKVLEEHRDRREL